MLYDRSDDIRAVQVCLRLARLMRGRSPGAYYLAVGQHLARLRRRTNRDRWLELVRDGCGLSPRRAYELMEIAAGAKTLAEQRIDAAARARKARRKRKTHSPSV